MTLKEAKTKILIEKHLEEIGPIFDFEDFWVFVYSYDEIDARTPAIRKNDGSLFWFFYPDYAHLKYKILSEEKGD